MPTVVFSCVPKGKPQATYQNNDNWLDPTTLSTAGKRLKGILSADQKGNSRDHKTLVGKSHVEQGQKIRRGFWMRVSTKGGKTQASECNYSSKHLTTYYTFGNKEACPGN